MPCSAQRRRFETRRELFRMLSMASINSSRLTLFSLVAFALLFAGSHLAWQLTHGGVVSHHLLDQRDLPAISNWWGLAILPLVGALAAWSAQRSSARTAVASAAGAFLVGIAMCVAFTIDSSGNASAMIMVAVLASGLVFPIYRAEYVFGFAIGMSFVFGLVLPTLISVVPIAISAAFHFLIRPALMRILRMTGVVRNAPQIARDD